MISSSWRRRRFLQAMGAGAATLPFYRMLENSAAADPGAGPLRVVLLFTEFGGNWHGVRPLGADGQREMVLTAESLAYEGSALAPLSKYASRMAVLEGIGRGDGAMSATLEPNSDNWFYLGHEHTGAAAYTGAVIDDLPNNGGNVPRGPSLDYALAQKYGGETAVRQLQMGIGGYCTRWYGDTLTYDESGNRMTGFTEPSDAFGALFAGATPADPSVDVDAVRRQRLRDRAVVGALQSSGTRLRQRLGTIERDKLDAHLDALADIERRLAALPVPLPTSCSPQAPPSVADLSEAAIPERAAAAIDVLAQGLACDRTRFVAGTLAVGFNAMPWLLSDVTDFHNDVAHRVEGDGADPVVMKARVDMAKINNWYASQIARLADRLDAVPEGNGSVLDNTLIIWTTDFGEMNHGAQNTPYVLLGGAQNRFRMGRYMNYFEDTGVNNPRYNPYCFKQSNNLAVSILQSYGEQTDRFNSDRFTGPLPNLT
jgi:Protein of unknown function (DUF1552)